MTEDARKKANLRLLQRTCDSSITDILASSAHVVLYQFQQASWSKSDVEGSLFLTIQSSGAYNVIILNRNSNNNFNMPVTPALALQHQDPYLICKRTLPNQQTMIQGIWFHNAQERISMTHALESIVQSLSLAQPAPLPNFQVTPAKAEPTGAAGVIVTPISALLASAHQSHAVAPTVATPNAATPLKSTTPTQQPAATEDERAHLANLLSQTAITAAAASSEPPVAVTATTTTTTTTTAVVPESLPGENVALDKKSLQLALLSLIQDDRFLDLLHSQYLRVIKARTKKGGS